MLNRKKIHIDYALFWAIAILTTWGIFTAGAISFPFSLQKYGTPWHYLFHQALALAAGILAGLAMFKMPVKSLKKWAPYLFLFNLFLLALVFLPKIGVRASGSARWLSFKGFSVQPSEFLKISFLLYLSAWLSAKNKIKSKKKFIPFFLPFIIILAVLAIALISQPDMTTLIIIALTGILMYFVIDTPIWHFALLLTSGIGAGLLMIKIAPYRLRRVKIFLNQTVDPLGFGWQLKQSLITIGSGKIIGIGKGIGLGLGLSRQKFGFLPHPMTDSIFAIIGEETGFVGGIFLISLFLFFAWRGFVISKNSKDLFLKMLSLGITLWISIQTFLNIGGIMGMMPLGGVPLPFFSYGGSHIITEMIAMGILLNISKQKQ